MSPLRVDFYLLEDPNASLQLLTACRLLEKAYARGHQVYVCCDNQSQAYELDELLWTFKEDSFIPHHLKGEGPIPPPPIQIGLNKDDPEGFHDILVNLSATIPDYFTRFKRVIEIIPGNEEAKILGRIHYKDYRARQLPIQLHSISSGLKIR